MPGPNHPCRHGHTALLAGASFMWEGGRRGESKSIPQSAGVSVPPHLPALVAEVKPARKLVSPPVRRGHPQGRVWPTQICPQRYPMVVRRGRALQGALISVHTGW